MLTSRRQQRATGKLASGFATTNQWRCDELKVECLFPRTDWMAEVGDLGGEGIASPSPLTLHDNSTSLKSAHIPKYFSTSDMNWGRPPLMLQSVLWVSIAEFIASQVWILIIWIACPLFVLKEQMNLSSWNESNEWCVHTKNEIMILISCWYGSQPILVWKNRVKG